MAMAGRHIRHDWQQFVEWNQKSVRTVCGKTSTMNATGIPGVTEQPEIVEIKGKKAFGWCTSCSIGVHLFSANVLDGRFAGEFHPYVVPMYQEVYNATLPIYMEWVARQEAARKV